MCEHSRCCEQSCIAIACVCVCNLGIMFCDEKSKNDGKLKGVTKVNTKVSKDAKTSKDLTPCNTFDILYYVVRPSVIFY